MKKLIIIVLVLLFGFILIVFGLFEYAKYRLTPIHEIIAVDIDVTPEWQEFMPEKSMTVRRQSQRIDLNVVGYKHDISEKLPWKITLQDGTVIKPEVQVIDEYGNAFDLHDGTRVGDTIGFSPETSPDRYTTFPDDRKYVKVRIRSDVPFRCSRIVWTNKDLK